jgi:Protein of unknown function (DUF4242)
MQKFIIERTVPGAGELGLEQVQEIARASCAAIESLGVPYVWHETYAAGDKLYCVHYAESAEDVLEHARRGDFPADLVTPVGQVFGPQTAAA